MKSSPVAWGNTVDLLPVQADAVQVGPQKNLCRFHPAAYRSFNKGDGDAGAFVTKTYVGGTLAHPHNVPGGLAAKQGIDWHQFTIDLKDGMKVLRVVFDAKQQVAQHDETQSNKIRGTQQIELHAQGKVHGSAN